MENTKEDVASIFFSNAKLLENNSLWVGVGEDTPALELSNELTPPFEFLGESVANFLYSLYLLLTTPTE